MRINRVLLAGILCFACGAHLLGIVVMVIGLTRTLQD